MKNTFKRAISLLLAITILALANIPSTVTAATTEFKDIKTTDWYYTYVNKLVDLKITSGIGNNKYGPANSVTRAEFVTFLCKTKGYNQTKGDPFTDTQKNWASGYIAIALANGIIDLPTDKKFRPNDEITRFEAVEMLCRALNISKDTTTKNPYTDIMQITLCKVL
ncbi:MAG: S-layer homology domain-containing protein [Ruminiclostridium sp.]